MISKKQQRDLDALTKMAYDVADNKVPYADYRKAEVEYKQKYGGY
jgi:hypothetical protein